MPKTNTARHAVEDILDLSQIPADAQEKLLRIGRDEARKRLAMGADPRLASDFESHAVFAACVAYCRWPGGGSIFGYAREAARNKLADECRREYAPDADRGRAADALNFGRRHEIRLIDKEGAKEGTDSIDALNVR
jgi:hypothetical protein